MTDDQRSELILAAQDEVARLLSRLKGAYPWLPADPLERVRSACRRLAAAGWRELLLRHGLDIAAENLAAELARPLAVDRRVAGFGDFSTEGCRGIEPGRPGESLLYHAFASAGVTRGADGRPLTAFPTPDEIEAVEDYAFAARHATLAQLREEARELGSDELAVVVFASEYRPAAASVHRDAADLAFSRTGVARAGTDEPIYVPAARGFVPHIDGDGRGVIRTGPVRFAAFVAARVRGNEDRFGPMNFNAAAEFAQKDPEVYGVRYANPGDDAARAFWVPLHKLFSGRDCLYGDDGAGVPIRVDLEAHLVNDKVRRVLDSVEGNRDRYPDRSGRPFVLRDADLAGWAAGVAVVDPKGAPRSQPAGRWLLDPVARPLVEPALADGTAVTLLVPPGTPQDRLRGALKTEQDFRPLVVGGKTYPLHYRRNPGYVNIRHKVEGDNTVDLNTEKRTAEALLGALVEGKYEAQLYLDFTGDGWVEVKIAVGPDGLLGLPRHAAYAVIAPPDFLPAVGQRELMEWSDSPAVARIWFVPPLSLSDSRVAPNVEHAGAGFSPDDQTATAIVSLPRRKGRVVKKDRAPGEEPRGAPPRGYTLRSLPDDASGVFAPGWDVGVTLFQDDVAANAEKPREHLASFTLGSPFPEDAKLCAALSSYWPAVAPDTGRVFLPIVPSRFLPDELFGPLPVNQRPPFVIPPWIPSVIPMTDDELGHVAGWDGFPLPTLLGSNPRRVRYASPHHSDYVTAALNGTFSVARTKLISLDEYRARILALNAVYERLGAQPPQRAFDTDENAADPRAAWRVLSFQVVARPHERAYRIQVFRPGAVTEDTTTRPTTYVVEVDGEIYTFLVAVASNGTVRIDGAAGEARDA